MWYQSLTGRLRCADLAQDTNDGGNPIRGQQLTAAEDVQRQKTVVVVVAMEEASFLLSVNPVVRGIEAVRCQRQR